MSQNDATNNPSPRYTEWRLALPLAAGLALGIALVGFLKLIARPMALLLVAATLAEALAPVVKWVEDRIHRRSGAIAAVYVLIAVVTAGLAWLVIPPLLQESRSLLDSLPTLITRLQQRVNGWQLGSLNFDDIVSSLPSRLGGPAMRLPFTVATTFIDAFVIIFLSIYWLAGGAAMSRFALSLLPTARREKGRSVLHEIGQAMGGYVRGVVINAVIMGVLAWIGLLLMGMPFAIVLGVLTMAGEIIPVVGPVIVGAIVALIALEYSVTKALVAVALYTALQQLEGHILTPNIMKRQTHVPQTLVLLAIVIGGALGGILGILVAIPLAAGLRVFVIRVLAPAERAAVGARPH